VGSPPHVRNIDRRRAVLGALMRAGRPLTVDQLVMALAAQGVDGPDLQGGSRRPPGKVVVDVLRYQMSLGRVRRVARATYEVLPDQLSVSMRWRCLHWRQLSDTWWEAHGALPAVTGAHAPDTDEV